MPTVDTPYGCIFYLRRGQGTPPIIALHGAAGTSRQWGYQLSDLGARFKLIALDLPGHGRSSGAPLQTIAEGAAQVTALLDALNIERAILLAHSMGGAIAQWLALHEHGRVAALILIGAAGQLPVGADLLHEIRLDWPAAVAQIVARAYAPGTPAPVLARAAGDLQRVDRRVAEADYRACAAFDALPRLHELTIPTLLIAGADDRLAPPSLIAATARNLVQRDLVIVPGAGHMVMIEQPDVVNQAIKDWLARTLG